MVNKKIEITSITILKNTPRRRIERKPGGKIMYIAQKSAILARANIKINNFFILNCIEIRSGKFGTYISVPEKSEGSNFKIFPPMKKYFQDKILSAFNKQFAVA